MTNPVLDRFRLDGRVAVVTGASSGLGAGFAVALAHAGADLVLAARRADQLAATAAAVEAVGRVDVLVNNAGLGTAVPALKETPEQFRRVVAVNLEGAYWMAQACARVMEPGSSIVNISSTLGLVASYAPQAAYAATKAGLIGLTRDLSQQWAGRRGIRVNAIAPGYFASEMTAEIPAEQLSAFVASRSPLGRLGEQQELDSAVVFLAAPASSYVTGSTLAVDAGMSGH
ncbi:hypothetical protein GCM10017691_61290 [Pseudonocardia petroleophila]|uniref:SDR family oxidoreductase n=1 Tax=Pseudonocardia petroleophila TaxID=37331 RepID=A0A7G7MM80_9PSEU|nr:SDR family oxidoreductase [Pseudonocardia petroleophila]QNG53891.1 SDR family oxidoreductase [Pseudonocardia petroleophila]